MKNKRGGSVVGIKNDNKEKIYRLDLHEHTSDFPHLFFAKADRKKYAEEFLADLFNKKGNLVLGIANFNDDKRYEKLVDAAKKIKEYSADLRFKDYFISVQKSAQKEKRKIFFVKADEIATEKGHVIIIGYKGKIKKRKFLGVLREAHKQNCIIIAAHPLHDFSFPYFFVSKILGEEADLSLDKKTLKKYKKDFDAIELDSYFPEDWKKIKKFSKKEKIPVIADSDAHFIGEFFRSNFEVEGLNFKNPEFFKKSLKEALKKRIKIHARKHGFTAGYKHGIQATLEQLGKRVGLLSD